MKRTIVVTGASRGLGAHIAKRASEEGFHVVGAARTAATGDGYEIKACDVTVPEQVQALFRDMRKDEHFYGVVNAAGTASMNLLVATPFETIQRIADINLIGTIHCCAAAGKLLCRRKRGRIINFSTIAVPLGLKGEAVYVASKAGIEGFTRSFAREMGDFGVTVNAVAPGPIPTDLTKNVPKANIAELISRQIIPQEGTPEDVWNVVSLLLSERANMISGDTIHVGGA